jgi:starch phosphorylase
VNGVAELHSNILKEHLFADFNEFYPGKFMNVTNGITPRRWLHDCNTQLSNLITKKLGNADWLLTMDKLEGLRKFADDPEFQREWAEVKLNNKRKLSVWFQRNLGVQIHPEALFDIQIKRIHEYKRQLLNILRVIFLYQTIKAKIDATKSTANIVPRVIVFAGKAAPGYHKAKLIIKLINSVAEKVNNDLSIQGMLKVVFCPNYSVSLAELIIPASDLSQHISTAGMEASGTSNMKFALNGGLIIGTLDGANIEIRDSIGHENMFIFGKTADQVEPTRQANSSKYSLHGEDPRFAQAVHAVKAGDFGPGEIFNDIINPLLNPSHDFYLLGADFASYLEAHERVDKTFQNKAAWTKMSILSTAGSGKFSSDRSIHEYAQKIWGVKPLRLPDIDHK